MELDGVVCVCMGGWELLVFLITTIMLRDTYTYGSDPRDFINSASLNHDVPGAYSF